MDSLEQSGNSVTLRESLAAHLLGRVADTIDITASQYERAKTSYETVGKVVTNSADPRLSTAKVFPQGSFAIGTVIRPIDKEDGEFDVDLACRLTASPHTLEPAEAKRLIGKQLSNDGRYAEKLEEKARCWRVNYEGDFHLDVCPLVSAGTSDAIPDKQLSRWVLTHPEAFAGWFNVLANKARTRVLAEDSVMKAEVVPFPDDGGDKGWLRRVVQLMKRHRDMWCQEAKQHADFAPISIILTTLAAKAFQREAASGRESSNPYALMKRIITGMADAVEQRNVQGAIQWWVASPVANENFANRWNEDSRWPLAFFAWHQEALASLQQLTVVSGLDSAQPILEKSFGANASKKAITIYAQDMAASRSNGGLRFAAAGAGLTSAVTASASIAVPRHTFFGE